MKAFEQNKMKSDSSLPQQNRSKPKTRRRSFYAITAGWFRWIHIYVSMLSFASLLFFAITGITLNHPTWFGESQQTIVDQQGDLTQSLAEMVRDDNVDKLTLAEWFREKHELKGSIKEFEVDDFECMIVFKGPGYSADVFVDRELATYFLTETRTSTIAVLNDLHKGRDSGDEWKLLIDISAVVMLVMSLSGFGLLFYLKKRRVSGVVVAVVGTILLLAVWIAFVP